jgi:hypothetical protein
MTEHPIIFSGPMVRAIIEGRKTQTRRVVKRTRASWQLEDVPATWCPYGQIGDLLWVRETWRFLGVDMNRHGRTHWVEDAVVQYKDETRRTVEVDWEIGEAELRRHNRWRPSIHMPRWASRLTLRITDVRVQRVQEISEEDADQEGIPRNWCGNDFTGWTPGDHGYLGPGEFGSEDATDGYYVTGREAFSQWWDSINAKRGYSWEANPWVWAISFERIAVTR